LYVEPVGKVPYQHFIGDVKKSDLVNSSTINNLMNGRGKGTPENSKKIIPRTFSTDSLERLIYGK
jgi:hypothetical protein